MLKVKSIFASVLLIALLALTACSGQTAPSSGSGSGDSGTAPADPLANYPEKPVRVLVGYGPGGGSDTFVRSAVDAMNLTGIVEQSFVVENMPESSGAKTFIELLQKPDDPYTLLSVVELGSPILSGAVDATFDDYKPLAMMVNDTMSLIVPADSPYNTLHEVLDAIKADPNAISIALSGALESSSSFRWYEIANAYGIEGELKLVPQTSAADVVTSIVGKHTDVAIVTHRIAVDYILSDQVKGLGVLSREREPSTPDVPTFMEQGIDMEHIRARGFWIGKGVSDEIVQFWSDKFKELHETEQWREAADRLGLTPFYLDHEEYKAFLNEEGPKFMEFVKHVQAQRK